MTNNVLKDLSEKYLQGIADDISNAKSISSIFPNMSDVGDVRENVLLKFLQLHLPARCSVVKGGLIFDSLGNTSRQTWSSKCTHSVKPLFSFLSIPFQIDLGSYSQDTNVSDNRYKISPCNSEYPVVPHVSSDSTAIALGLV